MAPNETTSVEKQQKFRETLNALTSLEGTVEQLENLTSTLCGGIPKPAAAANEITEVDSLARLLSSTPERITGIGSEIIACIDRLRSELD